MMTVYRLDPPERDEEPPLLRPAELPLLRTEEPLLRMEEPLLPMEEPLLRLGELDL